LNLFPLSRSYVLSEYAHLLCDFNVKEITSYTAFVLNTVAKPGRHTPRTSFEERLLKTVQSAFNFGQRMAVADLDDGVVYLIEPPLLVVEVTQ
jgi:hypothetical protein